MDRIAGGDYSHPLIMTPRTSVTAAQKTDTLEATVAILRNLKDDEFIGQSALYGKLGRQDGVVGLQKSSILFGQWLRRTKESKPDDLLKDMEYILGGGSQDTRYRMKPPEPPVAGILIQPQAGAHPMAAHPMGWEPPALIQPQAGAHPMGWEPMEPPHPMAPQLAEPASKRRCRRPAGKSPRDKPPHRGRRRQHP